MGLSSFCISLFKPNLHYLTKSLEKVNSKAEIVFI